jgi:hypothetical protein
MLELISFIVDEKRIKIAGRNGGEAPPSAKSVWATEAKRTKVKCSIIKFPSLCLT